MQHLIKIGMMALFLYSTSIVGAETSSVFSGQSFLAAIDAPDSLALLPPPPAKKSMAFKRDQEAYKNGLALRNTSRGKQAVRDADLSDANIGKPFSEALGIEISPQNTPITYDLLKRLREDTVELAVNGAKNHYMRVRPFVYYKDTATCYPKDDAILRKNGSYPSGHATFGWATALVLVEIRPQREKELLKRGYEFGENRVICGAHWQSDIDAGFIMGAADFARLSADPAFITEVAAAKKEIAAKAK